MMVPNSKKKKKSHSTLWLFPYPLLAWMSLSHHFPSQPLLWKYDCVNSLYPHSIPWRCECVHAPSLQSCPILCDPVDCRPPAPLSMGFSRQEHWTGLPCSPPGDLLDPGIEPTSLKSLALVSGFFITGTADNGDHLWSHFTDEEAEGQETKCSPRSHTWQIMVRPRPTSS